MIRVNDYAIQYVLGEYLKEEIIKDRRLKG